MKDPAFLFYSKDWIEGTAEMFPEEKGIYIDLLCYQHQKGSIPNDINRLSRLVRLTVEEFTPIWNNIKDKFIPNGEPNGERLVNHKLNEVMTERSEKGMKNKLIGTFAHVIRKLKLPIDREKALKQRFNVDELLKIHKEWNTESLTEWCLNGIPFIEDANENKDIINNKGEENEKPLPEKFFNIESKIISDVFEHLNENYKFQYPNWQQNFPFANIQKCAKDFLNLHVFETFKDESHFKNSFAKYLKEISRDNEIKKKIEDKKFNNGTEKKILAKPIRNWVQQ